MALCVLFSFNGKKQNKITRNTIGSNSDEYFSEIYVTSTDNTLSFVWNPLENGSLATHSQRLWDLFIFIRLLTKKNVYKTHTSIESIFLALNSWFPSKSINWADFQNKHLSCIVCSHTSKCVKKWNTMEIVSFVYQYHAHTRFSITTITIQSCCVFFFEIQFYY